MKVERTANRDVFAPPASYSQERLWFLEQLEPGTALYNIPYMATVKGAVHRAAFNKAVNRLIARHESLRTCFLETGGKPKQIIYAELQVEVDYVDISRVDPRAQPAELQRICTEVTSSPFDLTKAPLFRIMLASTGRETTIITCIHHIISDGWSLGVFQREISALYQEELGGRPAELPELRIQYADFAVWQRERLDGENLDRLKQYWTKQLEGATTVLEVPGDYPRPLKQTFSGDVHLFELAPELSDKIKALTTSEGTTLFMTLFAAFAVLLYRLTGHKDVLCGTPIAGRKGADVENLIGLFVNTLVLRAQMEADEPFLQLLADVKKMTIEAFEHQDMPFEKLVLELNPKRDLSHSPLIQVLFTLQNIPTLQAVLNGAPAETNVGPSQNLDGHTGTAKFDYALFVSEVRDKLQCSIEYNTDLFKSETIEETAEYFVALLNGIVADPHAPISTYPLITSDKRELVLRKSRGADVPWSREKGVHHLFEEQVERTPDAPAVAWIADRQAKRLTYAELNAYANRIAHELIARGVTPGSNVAICMTRSVHQIAAVLGVVKAGAAYAPLDPEHPQERLGYILGDVQAPFVLSTSDTRSSLDESVPRLFLDREAATIERQSSENPVIAYSCETPLYIIHTSGSTGRPKGVVMPHRPIVNLVEWQAREIGKADLTLQYASLNFDVASQEIWSTLSAGGCLQVVDENIRRDGPRLLDFVKSQRVNRLFLPPVTLEAIANAAAAKDVLLDQLREVIVAGDKLQVTDNVRKLFQKAPQAHLINHYGPTESHVVSSHTVRGAVSEWPAHPLIGKPIDNVQLYVLDENREPVPAKVSGELFIAGVNVATGYLNRSEESAKRFLDDPFSDGRMYRTGDVCRYNADWELEFIGRADQQIKLRGFRIEPGEIEIVLKRYDHVKDAVVVKRQSSKGEDQLAAYLAIDEGAPFDKAALRSYLADKLPAYMVPTHFVRLERFPMTGSGKIDRLRLPDPPELEAAREREQAYVAPRTEVEQFLADRWREILGLERVSVHDNFFELGGHSLSATQLVSRVRDEYGVELPLFRVFERPTVELLALEIVQRQAALEEASDLESLLSELESLSEEDSAELLSQAGED
jgi:amino acid adenylation domain-containing protein